MKKTIITAFFAAAAFSAAAQVVNASAPRLVDGVTAESSAISPDGSFLVVNTADGLKRIAFDDHSAKVVATAPGASKLAVSADGKNVIYRLNHYDASHMRTVSLESVTLDNGTMATLVAPTRNLAAGISTARGTVTAVADGRTVVCATGSSETSGKLRRAPEAATPVATINYGHLDITIGADTKTLDPLGVGSYLWPSINPDGNRILFYFVGRGAFTCALDGSDVQPVNAQIVQPVWAGNDVVIGTITTDDGLNFLSGALTAVSVADGATQRLTPDSIIALEPSCSRDGSRAIFTTPAGQVYTMTLR